LGGQGAPLVPIGDQLLFGDYDSCFNLGGFANVSFLKSGKRIAYDICPVNIVLNHLASLVKKNFDEEGNLARRGKLNRTLLDALNSLPFYKQNPPKSLGKEWVIHEIHPILQSFDIPVEDKLRTFTEHIATQITDAIDAKNRSAILITGGGAYNSFLTERISEQVGFTIKLPDSLTINFKEALIFAFLGALRWREEINCLKSCTGATHDSSGGAIYWGF
jgi:anhydro-N-acetylmuramic acid kinase